MAATYNITTLTGSDVSATFTFTGLNIVGTMSASAQMRKTAASPDIVALFTTSLNASNETATITLEASKTIVGVGRELKCVPFDNPFLTPFLIMCLLFIKSTTKSPTSVCDCAQELRRNPVSI